MDRMPAADNDDVPTLDRLRTVQANLRAAFPNSLVGQRRALEKAEQEVRELLHAANSLVEDAADGGVLEGDPEQPVPVPRYKLKALAEAAAEAEGR